MNKFLVPGTVLFLLLGYCRMSGAAAPDELPAPCSVTSLDYYTPPMPQGTVGRTPGEVDWVLTAASGSPTTTPTANSLGSQQGFLNLTAQVLVYNAETETSTWGVEKFYDDFCDAKGDSSGVGQWLPHTCQLAHQYSVVSPGRPDIGLLRAALRADLHLIGACGLTQYLDDGDADNLRVWFTLALGLDEVMREGFNHKLVAADNDAVAADPLAKLTPVPGAATYAIASSAANTGQKSSPQPDTPGFDYKLSVLLAVLHRTPGLQVACEDEAAREPAQAKQGEAAAPAPRRYGSFACDLMIGSILWDIHLCDLGSADAKEPDSNSEPEPGKACVNDSHKANPKRFHLFGYSERVPGCPHLANTEVLNLVYGTLLNDGVPEKPYDGVPLCDYLSSGPLADVSAVKKALSNAHAAIDDYVEEARKAYVSGNFTSQDMADDVIKALIDLEVVKLGEGCASTTAVCFGDESDVTALTLYRRLILIHEVIQAANGQNYTQAISVVTRAACTSRTQSGKPMFDPYGLKLAASTQDVQLAGSDLASPMCRLLYVGEDIIIAQNSADLETAAENFGSVSGSWRFKSASDSLWTISGLLGADYEQEMLSLPGGTTTSLNKTTIVAPVGIEWTGNRGDAGYWGVMISLIDIGRLVQTGGSETVNGSQVSTNTGTTFSQVWSPGVILFHTVCSPSPFVFGAGISYVPKLRTATDSSGTESGVSGYRVMLIFGVDASLWPL